MEDIKKFWTEFIKKELIPKKIMVAEFYESKISNGKCKGYERKTLNKHIISESDLVNEFVNYLKQAIKSEELSVHCDSVRNEYRNSVDISIHSTKKTMEIYQTQKEINDTAKCLIEVKYIPTCKPNKISDVEHDFDKLHNEYESFKIEKYVMICAEYVAGADLKTMQDKIQQCEKKYSSVKSLTNF